MIDIKRYNSYFNHFYFVTFINSLGFAFLSYFLTRGFLFSLNYLSANSIGVTFYRTFLDLTFTTPSTSDIWTYSNIITIYLVPVIISGMVFILFYFLYRTRFKYIKGTHKLFWLWMLLQSSTMALGGIIASVSSEKGVFYAFQWMYMPYATMMVLSLLSLVLLLFLGWLVGKNFLYVTESHKLIENLQLQKKHIVFSLFLPALISHVFIFLIQNKSMDKYNTVLLICGFLATIPILFQTTKLKLTILKNDTLSSVSIFALTGLICCIILLFFL